MEKQNLNSIEDLVFHKSFREWILNSNSGNADFWEKWVFDYPSKKEILNHAKAIVYALSVNHNNLSDEEISSEIKKILKKIDGNVDTIPVESFSGNKRGIYCK